MNGAPENPMTPAVPASSRRTMRIASSVNVISDGSNGPSAATSAALRIGRSVSSDVAVAR